MGACCKNTRDKALGIQLARCEQRALLPFLNNHCEVRRRIPNCESNIEQESHLLTLHILLSRKLESYGFPNIYSEYCAERKWA